MKDSILAQFLVKPLTTGAVWPSSPELSRTLTEDIDIEQSKSVVELGPGTGAVTGFILESIAADAKFFAVELNSSVINPFRRRYPHVKLYNDSAVNLKEMMKKEGLSQIDAVLSGLPWASFSDKLQEEILAAIVDVLPKGGYFTTFAYLQGTILPTGINFRKRLEKYFSSVEKSRVVWLNIPPAFVYRCKK